MILSHLCSRIVIVPVKEKEGWWQHEWVQEGDGWSGGLAGARGPPAVADDSTDSPAGDSKGGAFHTSLE